VCGGKSGNTGGSLKNAYGLAVYCPVAEMEDEAQYAELRFARESLYVENR
jgi:hypothetical protein